MKIVYDARNLPKGTTREIRRASARFWNEYGDDDKYDDRIRHHKDFLDGLKKGQIGETRKLLSLLNFWKCRISYDTISPLRKVMPDVIKSASKLPKQLEQLEISHLSAIAKMFESFDNIDRIGGTSTSKAFYLIRPGLFVLWDNYIADWYGFANNSIGYCRFLLLMRDYARELRRRYGKKKPSLEEYLCLPGRKWTPTMPKYLDEWNWMVITNEINL